MTMLRSSTIVAVASVALVVLIDLATGQGPPIYTSYMQAPDFRQPPPPPHGALHTGGFMGPANYQIGREEYEKAIELDKKDSKHEKKFEKELEKDLKKDEKYHDKHGDKYGEETTPAPGVLASFSNSMNDAWKSISTLGRSKRGAPGEDEKANATATPKDIPQARAMPDKPEGKNAVPAERAMDSYEYLQYKNQGYVYFKVPKYLVCNY